MISREQAAREANYSYKAGMKNIAYIAGILRLRQEKEGFIQQTNNLNQMIHFVCEDGAKIPASYRDGQPIKIFARMQMRMVGDVATIELIALFFDTPTIMDMPPREAWEQSLRFGVPTDNVRPPDFRPEESKLQGWKVSDAGNSAKLAGFVSSWTFEKPKTEAGNGCLIIRVRQTKAAEDLMTVRCYASQARAYAARLSVGMPLYFEGRISVDIKNTGDAANADGVLPVTKHQYLRVSKLYSATNEHISVQPDWVLQMIEQAKQARALRNDQRIAAIKARADDLAAAGKPKNQLDHAQEAIAAQTQHGALAASAATLATSPVPADVMAAIRGSVK
jgi:hypothetical protein